MPGIIPVPKPGLGIYLALWCSLACGNAYGRGNAAAEVPPIQNKAWVLAVTAVDVSSLPPSRQLLGEVMTRNLVEALKTVEHRVRNDEEYLYYTNYVWSKSQTAAAKTLVAKRGERDLLLFGGDPPWKYRKNLKALEAEIQRLEEALRKAEAEIPLIAGRPAFTFTEDTVKGTFPPPPKAGGEYRFCVDRKADAFLAGALGEFHGRVYLNLKLYTLASGSFQYEDRIVFSGDDTTQAVAELTRSLVQAVSAARPASLLVRTNPEDTMVLLNGSFAGRGTIGPQEHPPGTLELESFAEDHRSLSATVALNEGELAELYLNLQPLSRSTLTLAVPDSSATKVYQGAHYRGETPLAVEIPQGELAYFQVETAEGKAASVVIRGPEEAETRPDSLNLQPKPSYPAEDKRVEKTRRNFYNAYGRFWIALPIAFVINGIATAHINAYNRTGNPDLYDGASARYYISIGMSIVAGAALAETFYRIFRYLRTGGEDAAVLVKYKR
ncbi:MAG: hypothetical protein LBQ30_02160 [Treponema sp.]|nr:hypothetical protein [Treponema sp.]